MTSSVFKLFGTVKELEKAGVWINYGDVKFLVARAGGSNIAFADALKAKIRPFRHQIERDLLSSEDDLRITAEVYADTIIKDIQAKVGEEWQKGVPSEDGKVLPYSKGAVVDLLLQLPDLFRDLRQQASDASKFLKEQEDADEKN